MGGHGCVTTGASLTSFRWVLVDGRKATLTNAVAEQITSYLLLFGSHERSIALWDATASEPPDVFWPVFLNNWNICDGLWPMRKIMLSTLRQRKAELSPIGFMDPADRAFYDALPDRVTVFRGCGRRRVRGLPWATDRERAAFFARGGRFVPRLIRSLLAGKSRRPIYSLCPPIAKKARWSLIHIPSTGFD
jgi:hypothetical protein